MRSEHLLYAVVLGTLGRPFALAFDLARIYPRPGVSPSGQCRMRIAYTRHQIDALRADCSGGREALFVVGTLFRVQLCK